MARVAIVSYDVQTIFGEAGGVGAFTHAIGQFTSAGWESVSIVMTRIDWEPMRVDAECGAHDFRPWESI